MMESASINGNVSLSTMCLFLATALASQLMQYKIRKKDDDQLIQLRQLYLNKRLAERMSYDDLQDYLDELSHGYGGKNSRRLSHQQNINDLMVSPVKSAGEKDQENEFDFHPKNNNWSHFEENTEIEVIDGVVKALDEEDNDSSSSEQAFLWTSLTRKKSFIDEMPALFPPLEKATTARSSSWGDTIRKKIGSFVSTHSESSIGVDVLMDEERMQQEMYAGDEADAVFLNRPYSFEYAPGNGLAHHNRAARAQYNARIMPNKVVMVRHGQSEGNVDERLYSTTPDNAMRLTRLGWEQAIKAGQILKERVIATGEPVHFIVSPYVRTVETFHGIVSAWCDPSKFNHIKGREKRLTAWYGKLLELGLTWHEDPRIREQDFGNYQNPAEIKRCKEERHKFGAFFYRFPHGESASDVFDRVSTFLDSLWRSFDLNKSSNYVLVTHGISIRVLLARYFRYSIDQFSMLANPRNGEMVVLGHDGEGKLRLEGRCELELDLDKATDEKKVSGYQFHRRLRVLPKHFIRKIKVRVSPDDTLEDCRSPLQSTMTSE